MPRKRHKPEEIVTKLRQVDVLVSQGQGIVDAIRQIGVSEVVFVTKSSVGLQNAGEALNVIESWRRHYKVRPQGSFGYMPLEPSSSSRILRVAGALVPGETLN